MNIKSNDNVMIGICASICVDYHGKIGKVLSVRDDNNQADIEYTCGKSKPSKPFSTALVLFDDNTLPTKMINVKFSDLYNDDEPYTEENELAEFLGFKLVDRPTSDPKTWSNSTKGFFVKDNITVIPLSSGWVTLVREHPSDKTSKYKEKFTDLIDALTLDVSKFNLNEN